MDIDFFFLLKKLEYVVPLRLIQTIKRLEEIVKNLNSNLYENEYTNSNDKKVGRDCKKSKFESL